LSDPSNGVCGINFRAQRSSRAKEKGLLLLGLAGDAWKHRKTISKAGSRAAFYI
jgi:hypothetical protein